MMRSCPITILTSKGRRSRQFPQRERYLGFRALESVVGEPRGFAALKVPTPQVFFDLGMLSWSQAYNIDSKYLLDISEDSVSDMCLSNPDTQHWSDNLGPATVLLLSVALDVM